MRGKGEQEVNIPFTVAAGQIVILPLALDISLELEGEMLWQHVAFEPLSRSNVDEIRAFLPEYRDYQLWDLPPR